jgi:cytoskeletal protein CcmA (bactofilin family)
MRPSARTGGKRGILRSVMAWKRSRRPISESSDWSGFLGKTVHLDGTLAFSGTFRLESQVKGTLISAHTLVLGEGAQVEGQIEGNHVVISGRFNGVIFAKGRVEIQPGGIVTGEIHTPCLVIDPGGIFDGHCHMLASAEAAKPLTIPIRMIPKA